jgi:type I restriction enzyme S subunit
MTPYLRAANVKDGHLDLSDVKEMNFSPQERAVFALRDGDVLVTEGAGSLAAVGASAVWQGELDGVMCFQNTLLRLRPRAGTDGRYLAWWARHAFADRRFAAEATGVNIFHLSAERVRAIDAPVPPIQRQRAIADFLDVETARIDELISARRRQKVLLDERHAVSVREALTWDKHGHDRILVPLKRRWRVTDCKHRTPAYVDAGYPVVSPGDVEPGVLDLSRCHRFVDEADYVDLTEGRRPARGDVVYSRNASIGIAAYVSTDTPFTMGQDVCLIRSRAQDQRYLTYALNTIGVDQLGEAKVGSTFSRVNVAQILELLIPDREPEDQRAIADRLDELTRRYRLLTGKLAAAATLLQEHRQALITAAVTGQLDLAREIAEEAS